MIARLNATPGHPLYGDAALQHAAAANHTTPPLSILVFWLPGPMNERFHASSLGPPAGCALASDWTDLGRTVHSSPWPAGQRTFLAPDLSGLGRLVSR